MVSAQAIGVAIGAVAIVRVIISVVIAAVGETALRRDDRRGGFRVAMVSVGTLAAVMVGARRMGMRGRSPVVWCSASSMIAAVRLAFVATSHQGRTTAAAGVRTPHAESVFLRSTLLPTVERADDLQV